MDVQALPTTPPDGALRYRVDGTGTPVAVLPATCKLGLHTLALDECRATVHAGEVRITCPTCAATGADHTWRLTTSRPNPDRAELDDEPYRDLVRHREPAPQPQ